MLQRLKEQVLRTSSILKTVWSRTRSKAKALRTRFDNVKSRIYDRYGECKKQIGQKREKRRERKRHSYLYDNVGLTLEYAGLRVRGIVLYSLVLTLGALIGQAAKLDFPCPVPILFVVEALLLIVAFWLFKFKLDQYYILQNYSTVRALIVTFVTFSVPSILFMVIDTWPSPLLTACFVSTSPDVLEETTFFINSTKGMTPITYEWDLGDGTITSTERLTYTYTTTGTFHVLLTASNFIATDTFSDTVEILPPGSASIPPAESSSSVNSLWTSLTKSLRWSLVTLFFSSGLMALVKDSKTSLPALPSAEFLEALNTLKSNLRALCKSGSLAWSKKKTVSEIKECQKWVEEARKKLVDLNQLAASDRPMIRFLAKLDEDLKELEVMLRMSRDVGDSWKKYFSDQPPALNEVETKRRRCIERLSTNRLV